MQVIDVGGIVTAYVMPDSNQAAIDVSLPTAGSWFAKNWYVIFVIAIFLVACIASMIISLVRWNMRKKHRAQREEKKKNDLVGGLRRVASSFSMAGDNTDANSSRKQSSRGVGMSRNVSSSSIRSSSRASSVASDKGKAVEVAKKAPAPPPKQGTRRGGSSSNKASRSGSASGKK